MTRLETAKDAALAGPRCCAARRWWVMVWVIVLLYTGLYGAQIWRHTAVPYFDQAGYLQKVYSIKDKIRAHRMDALKLNTYLTAEPTVRPPLMMVVPAFLPGKYAVPRVIGEYWLLCRVAGLLAGAWVLTKVVGDGVRRVLPALFLIVLANWIYMQLNPPQYMMDAIFASFALLAFALVGWDMKRMTVASAAWCAAGALLLQLTKPAGVALEFPMFVVLVIRNVVWIVQEHRAGREWGARTVGRGMVYGAFLGCMYYLLQVSAYGEGVRSQYEWGRQGYWDFGRDFWEGLFILVPGWLVVLAAGWGVWAWVKKGSGVGGQGSEQKVAVDSRNEETAVRWLLAAGGVTVVWWAIFSAELTYTYDVRVTLGGFVIAVAVVLVLIRKSAWAVTAVTAGGVILFACSVGAATVLLEAHPLATWHKTVSLVPNPQRPIKELGLIPLMGDVQKEILGEEASASLVVVCIDDMVEAQALALALRFANGGKGSALSLQSIPWADQGLDLESLLVHRHWFLTKAPRNSTDLTGSPFAVLRAVDALLVQPESPLHEIVTPRLTRVIMQPVSASATKLTLAENPLEAQTITLYRLDRRPTPKELLAALAFIEPELKGTKLEASVAEARGRLQRALEKGTGVALVDAAAADAFAAEAEFKDVDFGGRFTLRGVRQKRLADGGIAVDCLWQSPREQTLDCTLAVHFVDGEGKVIGQGDRAQDSIRGTATPGMQWVDTIVIPADKARRMKTLGLGVMDTPRTFLKENHASSDWGGSRLLIGLK